jgi:hypothetical protein
VTLGTCQASVTAGQPPRSGCLARLHAAAGWTEPSVICPPAAGLGEGSGLVRREAELTGTGRVAVIAPPAQIAQTAAAPVLNPRPDLERSGDRD